MAPEHRAARYQSPKPFRGRYFILCTCRCGVVWRGVGRDMFFGRFGSRVRLKAVGVECCALIDRYTQVALPANCGVEILVAGFRLIWLLHA